MAHDNRMSESEFRELMALAEALAPDASHDEVHAAKAILGGEGAGLEDVRHALVTPVRLDTSADTAWERLRASGIFDEFSSGRSSERSLPRWLGYSILVVMLAAFGGRYIYGIVAESASASKTYAHITGTGERARITLSDGSTVTLAPNSRVQYTDAFGKSTRSITVQGEAMFVVTHNNGFPFIVNAGGVRARVLGTTFTISKYYNDSSVRVVVAEGKVAVNDKIASTGDVASAGSQGVQIEHSGDVTSYLAWVNGDIYWKSASVGEVTESIKRWYGLELVIPERNINNHFTATFHSPTVTELLSYLSGVLGTTYNRNGNRVVFK